MVTLASEQCKGCLHCRCLEIHIERARSARKVTQYATPLASDNVNGLVIFKKGQFFSWLCKEGGMKGKKVKNGNFGVDQFRRFLLHMSTNVAEIRNLAPCLIKAASVSSTRMQ